MPLWRGRFCGERACSRLSAQHSQNWQRLPRFWGRFAAQREQARSPQKCTRHKSVLARTACRVAPPGVLP
ncbi:hypothetical protein FQ192_04420 [Pseudomonas sp. ANT_J12]|nr:hypothetical protein FQ192_04420 [Pseudomonas sp. ANT_J12]